MPFYTIFAPIIGVLVIFYTIFNIRKPKSKSILISLIVTFIYGISLIALGILAYFFQEIEMVFTFVLLGISIALVLYLGYVKKINA